MITDDTSQPITPQAIVAVTAVAIKPCENADKEAQILESGLPIALGFVTRKPKVKRL